MSLRRRSGSAARRQAASLSHGHAESRRRPKYHDRDSGTASLPGTRTVRSGSATREEQNFGTWKETAAHTGNPNSANHQPLPPIIRCHDRIGVAPANAPPNLSPTVPQCPGILGPAAPPGRRRKILPQCRPAAPAAAEELSD
eukprot:738233-Hanusia_phi.AAC.1